MASFNHRITADIIPMEQDHDTEEDEDSVVPLPLLKRNLISDFDRRSVVEPSIPHERMKVFLRIRPFTEEEVERNEDQGCYDVESLRTVTTHPPPGSHFYKNMTRGLSKTTTKYTFSRIFNENTTQTEFFNSTMLCYVKDFIDGQNCVVFAYGVTNSGKTYTMQGNPPDETGVLPRTLDVLFNSIGDRQVSCESDIDLTSLIGCADDASDISTATNTTSCSESSNISLAPGKESMDCEMTFHELEQRDREEGKVSMDSEQSQEKFAVLVSFAEIYKEQIYDLLVPVPKKKNARRPCLKLSEDRTGSPYIKGLKHIQVSSADEAYKLLTIGQRNLQTACTKLNHSSSRSHCIFNIKLQRMTNQENSESARVSMLTLCDLAGTERIGKTHTIGDRLKEAGNINTSHLTLGKCIEAIRHNQLHKEQKRIVPFREAKLTRLLQNFFMGRGKAAMVVNVNQLASMFDETMQVFRFSAVASKVEVHQKPVFIQPKVPVAPVPAKIPKTSIAWATPCKKRDLPEAENVSVPTETDDDDDLEEDVTVYTQENIDELLVVIEQLQANLQTEIQNKYHEGKRIRKEVCEEMMKQFAELEEEHGERIRIREQRVEELAEKRYQIALDAERAKRKTPSVVTDDDDEWVSSVFLHQERVKLEHSDEQVKKLEQKSSEQSEHISNLENDAAVKSEQVKKLEQKSLEQSEQISKLENDASVKNEQVKKLEQQSSEQSEHIQRLEQLTKKDDISSSEESDKANIIENLTQQLQQARQHIKEQEKEISELNDMLSEAGETFEQKEVEITKLKELTTEYETKMEAQSEAIRVLERAASDSKVAMETADQSLSKREDCVATLQATIRDLEGTTGPGAVEFIPETPSKSSQNTPIPGPISSDLDLFRNSVSSLDLSCKKQRVENDSVVGKNENGVRNELERDTGRVGNVKSSDSTGRRSRSKLYDHMDSSGVVADIDDSEDCSDGEISFKPIRGSQSSGNYSRDQVRDDVTSVSKCAPQSRPVPQTIVPAWPVEEEESLVDYSGSDVSDIASPVEKPAKIKGSQSHKGFNFNEAAQNSNLDSFVFHKPLNDSRVLQVVLTPIKHAVIVKHTKSSMLRLKNSPAKDPKRGRECLKTAPQRTCRTLKLEGKENSRQRDSHEFKRKCVNDEIEENELNTSKRRKVVRSCRQKTKPGTVNKMAQKYNLRTRR